MRSVPVREETICVDCGTVEVKVEVEVEVVGAYVPWPLYALLT